MAEEMVEKIGLEQTVKHYQKRMESANPADGFSYICLTSACEMVIEHIKNKYKQ